MKTLSIVMTSYNYAQYLPQAIESILRQSIKPFEIIIVDDASQDNSAEIIKNYQQQSPLIRFFQNPHNLGADRTTNRALSLATGEYFMFFCADDFLSPYLCEKFLHVIERYPDAGLYSSKPSIFYDNNPEMRLSYSLSFIDKPLYCSPDRFLNQIKMRNLHLGGTGAVFNREKTLKAGGLEVSLQSFGDWFLVNTLALRYGICLIPDALYHVRIHESAYSIGLKKIPSYRRDMFKKIAKMIEETAYQDIRDPFIQSGVIHQLGFSIIPLLYKHRKFLNLPLIWHFARKIIITLKNRYTLRRKNFVQKTL